MPNHPSDHKLISPVKKLIDQALEEKVFPGGALLVSKEQSIVYWDAFGIADIKADEKVEMDTVFDMASLTKPLATTLAIMKLVQDGGLALEMPIKNALPEFEETDKKNILIKQLLGHTAGLVDYIPFFKTLKGTTIAARKKELRNLLINTPLKSDIGKSVLYSDLGFMILNWVIERVGGKTLDQFVAKEIFTPLGIDNENRLFFVDLNLDPKPGKYAATEFCPWRNRVIKGEVHDENAFAAGGIDGHAGLFGTITAAHELLSILLGIYKGNGSKSILSREILFTFLKEQGVTRRTLGFDMPSIKDSSAGKYFSKNSVGHLGFTGTSFWVDLERSIIVILFTNRIHPTRNNTKIKAFRPVLHDTVMELLR